MVSVGGRRMKIKKILTITTLLFIVLLNTACDDLNPIHKDHQTAIIEMDGDVSYIFKEDINNSIDKQILEQTYQYNNTNIDVDNNLYNFSIIFPIKSKTNLQVLLSSARMFFYTTDHKRGSPYGYGSGIHNSILDTDNYHHYTITIPSNISASDYFLNDIRDIEISYLYEQSNFSEDIKYDTNKLIIPKEQLINLLDSLAIPHDRLDFQTD